MEKSLFRWREADFDQFVRFVGGWLPFPLPHTVGSRLGKDRMAAFDIQSFDGSIRCDYGVDLDDSTQGQMARQWRILRRCVIHKLALGR